MVSSSNYFVVDTKMSWNTGANLEKKMQVDTKKHGGADAHSMPSLESVSRYSVQ